ncbi:MAG: pyridoxal-phosphate dependent enzyme [bacterium]
MHPFDDPLLWEGHATLIDEVVAAGIEFDAVLVGVGGGGLLAGMPAGLVRHGLSTPLVAVETTGAASYAAALAAGHVVSALPNHLRFGKVCAQLGFQKCRSLLMFTASCCVCVRNSG